MSDKSMREQLLRLNNLKLRTKLVGMGAGIALLTVALMIVVAGFAGEWFGDLADAEVDRLINADLDHLTESTYSLVQTQDEAAQQKVNYDLNVARHILSSQGGLRQCAGEVEWGAINQYTHEARTVPLPRMCVGDVWLGQNDDLLTTETLVVDTVKRLVGGTATIFQRMNEEGDLLRIATNVPKSATERAIGTYIPAVNPDGSPNPVVSTVMRGETYRGVAYVWDAWYITAYEPIFDAAGDLIGVLYVGVNQEDFGALYETIKGIQVGKTGYVYVLGGEGDDQGHYIISKDGERDGEDVWNVQDADGRYVIQDIVNRALALEPGELATVRHLWQNPGDPGPRRAMTRIAYYQPWDWVIGVSSYEDDYDVFHDTLSSGQARVVVSTGLVGLVVIVLGYGVAWVIARSIATRLTRMARAAKMLATGDLSRRVAVDAEDEIGLLARSFNIMADDLQQLVEEANNERNLLRSVIDNIPDSITVKDTQMRVLNCNLAFAHSIGLEKPEEIFEKPLGSLLTPEVARQVEAEDHAVMQTGEAQHNREIHAVGSDGNARWRLETRVPTRDGSNKVTGLVTMTRDITALKQAEVERERLQQEIIEAQKQAIRDLSTPIIPVMEGIIVMPLIGSIDASRAREITRTLLAGIDAHRARAVILDITGVPIVDSEVAAHLDKSVQTARLKGARTIVAGISDAVAEAVVDLGIDWGHVETVRDLQTGLAAALNVRQVNQSR
jgi:PAS domain S-box-containing protein